MIERLSSTSFFLQEPPGFCSRLTHGVDMGKYENN